MPFSVSDAWLFAFLQHIRVRPLMYLWNGHVRTLETYLRGYMQARIDLGVPELVGQEEDVLDEFSNWLAVKLKNDGNFGWADHIESLDPSNNGIQTFFRELDEFLVTRNVVLPRDIAQRWPPDPPRRKKWPLPTGLDGPA